MSKKNKKTHQNILETIIEDEELLTKSKGDEFSFLQPKFSQEEPERKNPQHRSAKNPLREKISGRLLNNLQNDNKDDGSNTEQIPPSTIKITNCIFEKLSKPSQENQK